MDRLKLKQSVPVYLYSSKNMTKKLKEKPMIIVKYSKMSE